MIGISKPQISEEEINAVRDVLNSGNIVQGEKVREFENNFSSYCGIKHGVATSSGTSALEVALRALDIGKYDEVITTGFSFIATANCIMYTGATPVFADIDSRTFNIDSDKIEEKITEKTKAVIVVHLYGQPCEMGKIMAICKKHNLKLIEDACQAHGAEYKGRKTGSFGDISCFSFYATKNITTSEGGMCLTNEEDLHKKMKLLINHGMDQQYKHEILGYNYRMTDIQAAIGIEQLKKLNKFNEKRIKNAGFFNEKLRDIEWVSLPFVSPGCRHVFHQYTLRILNNKRDQFLKYLNENHIGARIYYPVPIFKQPVYKKLGYNIELSNTEKACEEVISIPVHPGLTKEDLEKISKKITEFKS